ncbi:MAG: hypothetical protein N2651_01080 [Fimbriimonadales bacterium]|nr:hypothetical protein [Fimbriimonadales bacterium]
MQTFRDKPVLAVGLLIVALVVVFLSWFLFIRPASPPAVEPVTPPPVQQNPDQGQGQML